MHKKGRIPGTTIGKYENFWAEIDRIAKEGKLLQLAEREALDGNIDFVKLLARYVFPKRETDRRVTIDLPSDPAKRGDAIINAVATGHISPTEGERIANIIIKIQEHDVLQRQVAELAEIVKQLCNSADESAVEH